MILKILIKYKCYRLFLEIRKIPNDKNIEENNDSKLYIHDINTKYYSTKIAFYAVENFDELPESVSDKCEGIIIYFNPNDVSSRFKINIITIF